MNMPFAIQTALRYMNNKHYSMKGLPELPYMFWEQYKLEDVKLGTEATEYSKFISKHQGQKSQ